jgi:hypothetical protein
MQDPFSSVENMLRWQIDAVQKRAEELKQAFPMSGELYPLPKSTDGLPDSWAFGKLTHQQVSLAHALNGIKLVANQIEKTEAALSNGDLPTAIHWIIQVNQSIFSTSAQWAAAAAVRTFRYVEKGRKRQSIIARYERKEKPTKEILQVFKDKWIYENGTEWGWLKAACREFKLAQNTIKNILN